MVESTLISKPAGQSTERPSKPPSLNNNENDDDDTISSSSERTTSSPETALVDLEKAQTARSTTGSTNTARKRLSRTQSIAKRPPPGFFQHPLSHVKTSGDVIVNFDGPDDPYRPLNWPMRKKIITTILYGLTTMGATWASSVYSPAIGQISGDFRISKEVSTLGLSLLLMGFGLGPMIWAPLSEVYGRKPAVFVPYFIAAMFSLGTATAKDVQTIMITRFFAGFFGSAPVTNTGGVLGDIWNPKHRGIALVGYAFAVVGGPSLGPIAGSAIVQSYLRWRWTEYLTAIMMLSILTVDVLVLDESYGPSLLVAKARRLRHETGNWALHARHEEWDVSLQELAHKYGARPFQMLATPICFLVASYASFVYGILYLSLAAFPIAFEEERGWNQVVGSLPFLALLLGTLLGGAANVMNNHFYIRRYEANGCKAVPEARLPPMMFGSISFAAGLFVFGWTSDKDIPWIATCIGAVMIGFGFFTIFQAALNYLIDTFSRYAASAIAANTFLRSIFAASFPLFATPMFHHLGIGWASSILGFVAIGLIPIPFIFYIYGPRIRKRGKFSAEAMS